MQLLRVLIPEIVILFAAVSAQAEQPATASNGATAVSSADTTLSPSVAKNTLPTSPGYVLGTDDSISIHAFPVEEIPATPITVGADGLISLPLVGRVQAGGVTVRQLENEIATKLDRYIQHPSVTITVTEYRSQPVSILGEVNNAGVHQLRGPTTLLQTMSMAGGLKQDAGYRIKIVRPVESGPIPLPGAAQDQAGKYTIAELNIKDVLEARRPEDNIPILANDVITVPRAEMVYVVGEVNKSGAFILTEKQTMSVLQALSQAGGLKNTALAGKCRILRPQTGSSDKKEISVNIGRIFKGAEPDVPLYPDDVLFVPNNTTKSLGFKTLDTLFNIGTGVAIWGR
jgi:polysaccharide export outer membrane protein